MSRLHWADLPPALRIAVEEQFGPVTDAQSTPDGLTVGLAARVATPTGPVFLKAVRHEDPTVHHYQRERTVGRVLPGEVRAPRLLWSHDTDGWLLLAFEYVTGRTADLSPGSADVPAVLRALDRVRLQLTPSPWRDAPRIAEKISILRRKADLLLLDPPADVPDIPRLAAAMQSFRIDGFEGDTLLHADLHAGNLIAGPDGVHLIDWSLACNGADWIDLALFVPRLVTAGHPPAEAENLLRDFPAWKSAPSAAVTALTTAATLFREYEAHHGPPRLRAKRAEIARAGHAWLRYRTR